MARVAHQMAVESEQIVADVVEISEFPDMARRYGVTGVPKIVINDEVELLGAQPESAFVEAVCKSASAEASADPPKSSGTDADGGGLGSGE